MDHLVKLRDHFLAILCISLSCTLLPACGVNWPARAGTREYRLQQAEISNVPGVTLVPATDPDAAQEAQRYAIFAVVNYELFTTDYRAGGTLHDILRRFAPGSNDHQLISNAPLPDGTYYLHVTAIGGEWGIERQAFQAFEKPFGLKVTREKRPRDVLVLQRIPGQSLDWKEFSAAAASADFQKALDEVANLGLPNAEATDDVAYWLEKLAKEPDVDAGFGASDGGASIECVGGRLGMKQVAFHLEQLLDTIVLDETGDHSDRAVALVVAFPLAANDADKIAGCNKALARHGLMLVRVARPIETLYVSRVVDPAVSK